MYSTSIFETVAVYLVSLQIGWNLRLFIVLDISCLLGTLRWFIHAGGKDYTYTTQAMHQMIFLCTTGEIYRLNTKNMYLEKCPWLSLSIRNCLYWALPLYALSFLMSMYPFITLFHLRTWNHMTIVHYESNTNGHSVLQKLWTLKRLFFDKYVNTS